MSEDLTVEAKEIFDTFIEKDFKEWFGDELKKTVEKTDHVSKVIIEVKWNAPIWEREYQGDKTKQFLVHKDESYKTFFDVVKDNGIGIKVSGDSIQFPQQPLDNIKSSLYPLWNAESFNMNITASALGKNNVIINTKEWTYSRTSEKSKEKVPEGCVSGGKAVLDELEQKDFKEWLTGLKIAEKTDQVAKIILNFKWMPKVWKNRHALELSEQNSVPSWFKRRVLVERIYPDEDDDKIEIDILNTEAASGLVVQEGTLKSRNKSPIEKYKKELQYILDDAVSFTLRVQATALSPNNAIIDRKEWTYKHPA